MLGAVGGDVGRGKLTGLTKWQRLRHDALYTVCALSDWLCRGWCFRTSYDFGKPEQILPAARGKICKSTYPFYLQATILEAQRFRAQSRSRLAVSPLTQNRVQKCAANEQGCRLHQMPQGIYRVPHLSISFTAPAYQLQCIHLHNLMCCCTYYMASAKKVAPATRAKPLNK